MCVCGGEVCVCVFVLLTYVDQRSTSHLSYVDIFTCVDVCVFGVMCVWNSLFFDVVKINGLIAAQWGWKHVLVLWSWQVQ